jgi:D-arabinose 1-dehydrogenase-like Zn-dependent alcohol dehydrogenase
MAKMKAVQVPKAGADFEIVEREIPEPGAGQVRIRVQACGICHSDVITKEGLLPGITYPRVPGHEVAGVIDELGAGVKEWRKGQRVGVGWHGGQDGTCPACRRGDFVNCANEKICGITFDGGYQEYMVAPVEALAQMPESLDAAEAAPLMCAGVTTFNSLRHSGALPSDLVAVQGVGGLGHLGIQFAAKFGYRVAAVGRGPDNAALAKKLGAEVYIDSSATDPAAELQKLGGASVILATAPSGKAMSALVGGLGANGTMFVVGASMDPIEVAPNLLLFGKKGIKGWAGGIPTDSQDTLRFAEMTGVRPMIERYPLAEAAAGYARMMSGKAEFRVVLTT